MSSDQGMEYARSLDLPPFVPIDENYLPKNAFINFHFAPHGIPEHLEGVAAMLPDADILVVELVNWTERDVKTYKAIAKGDEKILRRSTDLVEEEQLRDYIVARFQMIFRSWKPLLFIDQSAAEKQERIPEFIYKSLADFKADSLDEALELCADIESEVIRKSSLRNRIIVRNLGEKATELITQHPKLKDKPRVEVLVPLGMMHEPIYLHLMDQPALSDRVAASYWAGADHLPPEEEGRLAYIEGRSPTRDQLIATLAVHAFSSSVASFTRPGESIYHPYRTPPGVQDTEHEVALRAIQLITATDAGIEIILNRLNGDRSAKNKEQIMHYVDEANQQILAETGQGLDMDEQKNSDRLKT